MGSEHQAFENSKGSRGQAFGACSAIKADSRGIPVSNSSKPIVCSHHPESSYSYLVTFHFAGGLVSANGRQHDN